MKGVAPQVLGFGAFYGSLLEMESALAGHDIHLICLPHEVEEFNLHGASVRVPVRGRQALLELNSSSAKGHLRAIHPWEFNLSDYNLVILGMRVAVPPPIGKTCAFAAGDGWTAMHVDHEHAPLELPQANAWRPG